MRLLILLALTFSLSVQAKLLDKIAAVIDNEVITLSMIKRVQSSLPARKSVSPFIYKKPSYSNQEVVELLVKKYVVRAKLKEIGYIVSDDQVESEIKSREQKLGLSRPQLLQFLKNNGTNYEEFFEITREAIEFNRFNSWVIIPLVSVSEQEIKNQFFKENVNNKTVSFKYTLVDFSIEPNKVPKSKWKTFKNIMIDFQKGAPLPKKYSSIESTTLGDIKAENLTKDLQKLLVRAQEGQFTDPINMFGKTHIFFVKNRDVVESELFLNSKNMLRAKIYEQKAREVTKIWFAREEANHYIKKFL
ncbi:SurA domain-containing protein [Bacteriovorax sp. DB6_IX]|uniref:SurA domain-containing protein n=1 Tax=Bacteriovorax sp. DB6_IX TaxID=1353530 RepID=UPI00038A1BDB|nr:SurA domain-containing protein [Bacteriovorax sp. DB6_IX]EQC52149.1 SurA N-terminal domain protein [Bacteriovorax sp. DB6_IX]